MRLILNVEYLSGEVKQARAITPDYIAWERKTKKKMSDLAKGAGLEDLALLAWSALNRESALPDFDEWTETVAEISLGESDDPKSTK